MFCMGRRRDSRKDQFDPKLYVSEPNFSRHHRRRFNRAADGGRRILHRAQLTGGPLLTSDYHLGDQRLSAKRWDGGAVIIPVPTLCYAPHFLGLLLRRTRRRGHELRACRIGNGFAHNLIDGF